MSLAPTRHSCKDHLTRDQLLALKEHCGPGGCMHLPRVEQVEAWLVKRLEH